jgi:hypothetical protein
MFEILMACFHNYGTYFVLLILAIKIIALDIYKPNNFKYLSKRLFLYHHRYVVRSEDYVRWGQFRNILNPITIVLHLSIIFWIASFFLYR